MHPDKSVHKTLRSICSGFSFHLNLKGVPSSDTTVFAESPKRKNVYANTHRKKSKRCSAVMRYGKSVYSLIFFLSVCIFKVKCPLCLPDLFRLLSAVELFLMVFDCLHSVCVRSCTQVCVFQ